ncbi:MAG: glycosyltransferase family 2 protein [Candidatus Micrarchaeota archaeon]|nr:glycosyltransferase family 2 protein [Candidatus Micrarchaeota archaeon]
MPLRKTLSICIPTFNRAKYLDRLLASISKASAGLVGSFEICISDNCSVDDTRSTVKRWKNKLPIIYCRNNRNIGFDANIVKVAQLARGDYIWFFGDDDVLAENALGGLIENLEMAKRNGISVIYVNCGSKNSKRGGNFDFSKMQIFRLDEFQKYPLNVFFMDVVCVSRPLVRKIANSVLIRPPLVIKKKGNPVYLFDFMHTYIFLEALSASTRFCIDPVCRVIPMHDGNDVDFDIFLYHFLNHMLWQVHIYADYPWFRQKYGYDTIRGKFVRTIAVINVPALEEKYLLCRDMSLLVSRINHDSFQKLQIWFFDAARGNFLAKRLLLALFMLALTVFKGIKISPSRSQDPKMKAYILLAETLSKKVLTGDYSGLTVKQLKAFEW